MSKIDTPILDMSKATPRKKLSEESANKLKPVVYYLCHRRPMSQRMLELLIYLADWKLSVEYGKRLTNIQWTYNRYGPQTDDINTFLSEDFNLARSGKMFGLPQQTIYLRRWTSLCDTLKPSGDEAHILECVLRITRHLEGDEIWELLLASCPVWGELNDSPVDLLESSQAYRHLYAD